MNVGPKYEDASVFMRIYGDEKEDSLHFNIVIIIIYDLSFTYSRQN